MGKKNIKLMSIVLVLLMMLEIIIPIGVLAKEADIIGKLDFSNPVEETFDGKVSELDAKIEIGPGWDPDVGNGINKELLIKVNNLNVGKYKLKISVPKERAYYIKEEMVIWEEDVMKIVKVVKGSDEKVKSIEMEIDNKSDTSSGEFKINIMNDFNLTPMETQIGDEVAVTFTELGSNDSVDKKLQLEMNNENEQSANKYIKVKDGDVSEYFATDEAKLDLSASGYNGENINTSYNVLLKPNEKGLANKGKYYIFDDFKITAIVPKEIYYGKHYQESIVNPTGGPRELKKIKELLITFISPKSVEVEDIDSDNFLVTQNYGDILVPVDVNMHLYYNTTVGVTSYDENTGKYTFKEGPIAEKQYIGKHLDEGEESLVKIYIGNKELIKSKKENGDKEYIKSSLLLTIKEDINFVNEGTVKKDYFKESEYYKGGTFSYILKPMVKSLSKKIKKMKFVYDIPDGLEVNKILANEYNSDFSISIKDEKIILESKENDKGVNYLGNRPESMAIIFDIKENAPADIKFGLDSIEYELDKSGTISIGNNEKMSDIMVKVAPMQFTLGTNGDIFSENNLGKTLENLKYKINVKDEKEDTINPRIRAVNINNSSWNDYISKDSVDELTNTGIGGGSKREIRFKISNKTSSKLKNPYVYIRVPKGMEAKAISINKYTTVLLDRYNEPHDEYEYFDEQIRDPRNIRNEQYKNSMTEK